MKFEIRFDKFLMRSKFAKLAKSLKNEIIAVFEVGK
jgi:hypothetical protein